VEVVDVLKKQCEFFSFTWRRNAKKIFPFPMHHGESEAPITMASAEGGGGKRNRASLHRFSYKIPLMCFQQALVLWKHPNSHQLLTFCCAGWR